MSIIVDGYNYIGRSREFKLSDPEVKDKVIYLLGQYCNNVHKSLTLVFDGNYFVDQANRKRRYGRVTVIYTSPIYTADELIKKMVREQEPGHRKALLVVSSDDEILQYTKSHGAAAVRSEEFERTINQALASSPESERANVHVSSKEVQEWLKIFGTAHADHESSPKSRKIRKTVSTPETGELKPAQALIPKGNREKSAEDPQPSKDRLRAQRKDGKHAKSRTSATEEELDKIEDVHLSPKEVQEWLKIFGATKKE